MFAGSNGGIEPIMWMSRRELVDSGAQYSPAGHSALQRAIVMAYVMLQESLHECEAQLAAALKTASASVQPIALVRDSSCAYL